MTRLYTINAHDAKTQRLMNRLWTRIKTGRVIRYLVSRTRCSVHARLRARALGETVHR